MHMTTAGIVTAMTPAFMGTCVSHYTDRKSRKNLPTAHIGYDLGLNMVRTFMNYMAKHPVEDAQIFTQQWVPAPQWVKRDRTDISSSFLDAAAKHIIERFGPLGMKEVGGEKWWQWRPYDAPLQADWIEMKKDYNARKGEKSNRVLLYIHGGAYYFGSTDEHGYQIQRHARKLKARCLAPRYRLSPQFPFPCGLQDILASYLYLLSEYDPKCILISGDSAGGGMTASLLTLLRDCGIPLPAGAMLISPWVDLTHSFPSICGDGKLDYIPIHGFVHKPSISWPPPRLQMEENVLKDIKQENPEAAKRQRKYSNAPFTELDTERPVRPSWIPEHIPDHHITPRVELGGKPIYIKDQIQLYAPNFMLMNPFVSPLLNPSLGGLCPLLIQVGGKELLHDEQIYFAHKAANPEAYPPNAEILDRWDPDRTILHKYPPTNVQLQVWDDVCHVPHTLAWTKPAKYMYRSVAQFGAWALARAQQIAIDIDDGESTSGTDEETEASPASRQSPDEEKKEDNAKEIEAMANPNPPSVEEAAKLAGAAKASRSNPEYELHHQDSRAVGKAGDPLPPFKDFMIRQRIDRHGNIHELAPAADLECMTLDPHEIGLIKEAPVHRWRERQTLWEERHASQKAKIDKKRADMEAKGHVKGMENETPPPTALVRRWVGLMEDKGRYGAAMYDHRKKKSVGLGLKWWSGFGNKHDKVVIEQATPPITSEPIPDSRPGRSHSRQPSAASGRRKSSVHSHRSMVVDKGQADANAIRTSNVNSPNLPASPDQRPISPGSESLQVPFLSPQRRNMSNGSARSESFPQVLQSAAEEKVVEVK